ncbi:hypothetical protein HX062_02775, partial [Myroides sp. DF42-4-2]|nr:hypothetical protein [Myroides sp. DF42-4-2]
VDANGNTSYIFKDAAGNAITTIALTEDVVNNITNKGDVYDAIVNVVDANETLTVLSYDINANALVYQDEEGKSHTITLNSGGVTYDADKNELTYVGSDKQSKTITLNNTSLSYDATTSILTYVNSQGGTQTIDLSSVVSANETLTVLSYNIAENKLTYKDESGVETALNLGTGSVSYDSATNTLTYVDAKGVSQDFTFNETGLTYDENTNSLTYKNSKGESQTINLSALVSANETLTVLSYDIPTNALVYQDEEGKSHTITLNSGGVTYDADKNELTYVGSDKQSKTITLNNTSLSYDATTSILTYVNSQGGKQEINLNTTIHENTSNALTLTGNKLTSTVNGKDASVELSEENVVSTKGITSTSITVGGESNGANATLKNVTLEIKPGNVNQILVTGADGKTAWVDQSTLTNVTLAGDVTGSAGSNEITSLQGTEVETKGQKTEGQVLTYQGGKWIAATPNVDATAVSNAKDLTAADGTAATIEVVTGGTQAVLVETSLRVKGESITSKEIQDGSIATADLGSKVVTADKLGAEKADEGKVPVVQADGSVVYQKIAATNVDGEALTSANALLTVDGDATSSLLKAVNLTVNEAEFNIENMKGNLAVTRIEAGAEGQILTTVGTGDQAKAVWTAKDKSTVVKGATSNVVVTQGAGNEANEYTVDVKAAMPKVFYMPPVMFDTSKKHNEVQTRNLYEEYVSMFGGSNPVVDTPIEGTRPGLIKNNSAEKATIPTFDAKQLDFYVAYYDPAVFEGVAVSDAGVLTYKIKKKAKYGAFMTVVFVVRDTPRQ